MIRVVGLPARDVAAHLALLAQRFGRALRVDAERGRKEAAVAVTRLRQMGRVELAALKAPSTADVVLFEVRTARDSVGGLLWPRDETVVLMDSDTDGAFDLASAVAECLGGEVEEE